jgi:hypothetical protein
MLGIGMRLSRVTIGRGRVLFVLDPLPPSSCPSRKPEAPIKRAPPVAINDRRLTVLNIN